MNFNQVDDLTDFIITKRIRRFKEVDLVFQSLPETIQTILLFDIEKFKAFQQQHLIYWKQQYD